MKSLILYLALKGLVANEGFVPHAYEDIGGVWHIGFGYNLEEHYGEPAEDCPNYSCLLWTREQAFEMLVTDIVELNAGLEDNVVCYRVLKPKAKVVLVDMAYNMGLRGALV